MTVEPEGADVAQERLHVAPVGDASTDPVLLRIEYPVLRLEPVGAVGDQGRVDHVQNRWIGPIAVLALGLGDFMGCSGAHGPHPVAETPLGDLDTSDTTA